MINDYTVETKKCDCTHWGKEIEQNFIQDQYRYEKQITCCIKCRGTGVICYVVIK